MAISERLDPYFEGNSGRLPLHGGARTGASHSWRGSLKPLFEIAYLAVPIWNMCRLRGHARNTPAWHR